MPATVLKNKVYVQAIHSQCHVYKFKMLYTFKTFVSPDTPRITFHVVTPCLFLPSLSVFQFSSSFIPILFVTYLFVFQPLLFSL